MSCRSNCGLYLFENLSYIIDVQTTVSVWNSQTIFPFLFFCIPPSLMVVFFFHLFLLQPRCPGHSTGRPAWSSAVFMVWQHWKRPLSAPIPSAFVGSVLSSGSLSHLWSYRGATVRTELRRRFGNDVDCSVGLFLRQQIDVWGCFRMIRKLIVLICENILPVETFGRQDPQDPRDPLVFH